MGKPKSSDAEMSLCVLGSAFGSHCGLWDTVKDFRVTVMERKHTVSLPFPISVNDCQGEKDIVALWEKVARVAAFAHLH